MSDAVAQDLGPINTERPSFSSSPLTLPTGYWQIEAGSQVTRNSGESSLPEGAGPAHNLNGGITWLLANALQVDIHAAAGLNSRANDYSVGTGIAYRF